MRWWRWLLVGIAVVAVLTAAGWVGLAAATSRSQLARAIVWGESDTGDHRRFPARPVAAGPERFDFRRPADGARVPPAAVRTVSVQDGDQRVERDLEQFLAASDTTAFLIVRGDTLLYEGYFNGADHDSVQTSMSMAKSVLSALVGIAIGEGRIGSVDDPITRYVPELGERDRRFGQITLRHLLTMTSGLRYDESGGPWGDDTATYYAPDLRALALTKTEVVEEPGRRFHYNNFNPLLLGLALERATGTSVSAYLEAKLWQPLGMEADGSWSLDSEASGFEKLESGLNARAADFARFGLLFARDGAWQGRQLVPRAWVNDRTLVPTGFARAPAPGYQYFWWVQDDRRPPARFALGKYGQHLYVVPDSDLVLVRFGRDAGYPHWPELLDDLARRLDQSISGKGSPAVETGDGKPWRRTTRDGSGSRGNGAGRVAVDRSSQEGTRWSSKTPPRRVAGLPRPTGPGCCGRQSGSVGSGSRSC
jgi:CubicO group peptidase (beta-lactamase class C family)